MDFKDEISPAGNLIAFSDTFSQLDFKSLFKAPAADICPDELIPEISETLAVILIEAEAGTLSFICREYLESDRIYSLLTGVVHNRHPWNDASLSDEHRYPAQRSIDADPLLAIINGLHVIEVNPFTFRKIDISLLGISLHCRGNQQLLPEHELIVGGECLTVIGIFQEHGTHERKSCVVSFPGIGINVRQEGVFQ